MKKVQARKRLMSLAVMVSMLALVLSGCSGGNSGTSTSTAAASTSVAEASTATADTSAAEDTAGAAETETEPAAGADYGPAIELTMGSTGAVEDISTKSAQYFTEIVEEKSGGAIKITLYPASQLGAATDQMEMLATGAMDLFLEANFMASYGVNNIKASSTMFCTRSKEDYRRIAESDYFWNCAEEFRQNTGMRILCNNWFRNSTAVASKNKIESLDDCQGVKLRVPPVNSTVDMFNALGFNATPVAYNETLISMQQGVVDAVWCTEDAIWTMGFYEPANYVYELNASYDSMFVYANDDWFSNSLTDAQRELIQQCAVEAGEYYTSL
ncbi:MAG: TRAP transporter substrate-binding protein, partial [Lachnospiraceae bacterium]|nr:TRAP transporter substrate-binding protein [Lachnospiraceae bacterium]